MRRFKATLLSGHKGLSLELPFPPSTLARPLWHGRRGHPARGTINGIAFENAVVPRSRRFWLLVDDEIAAKAGVGEGDEVEVTIELL